jgi:hypothetical protein
LVIESVGPDGNMRSPMEQANQILDYLRMNGFLPCNN